MTLSIHGRHELPESPRVALLVLAIARLLERRGRQRREAGQLRLNQQA